MQLFSTFEQLPPPEAARLLETRELLITPKHTPPPEVAVGDTHHARCHLLMDKHDG